MTPHPDMAQLDFGPPRSALVPRRRRAWWALVFVAVFMAGAVAGIVATAWAGGWL